MGRGHGGSRGRLGRGDSSYNGPIENIETLKNMKNAELYGETKAAISRYHTVLGVRQKNVKLAKMDPNILGVHTTMLGQSESVYLNSGHFKSADASPKEISKMIQKSYDSGHSTRTNKPVAHVITHELAHATWNSHLKGERYAAAGKAIRALYKTWSSDRRKTGYGRYASTNVNEFFAETATKAVHGKADRYTVELKKIVKTYGL